jgi:hypothetical protein
MESTCTIVTDQSAIAKAIKEFTTGTVLEIQPYFIDLADPGYDADYRPVFTVKSEVEKKVAALKGTVVCITAPRTPGPSNMLLFHLMYTLRQKNAVVLHAPLPALNRAAIEQALDKASKPDPWYITSLMARRLTERLIGRKLVPALAAEKLFYNGWISIYYLLLLAEQGKKFWQRRLMFGKCVAEEIDAFGSPVRYSQEPGAFKLEMDVIEKTRPAFFPDPRYRLNQWIIEQAATMSLVDIHNKLDTWYNEGKTTWPFTYGGIEYGQPLFESINQVVQLPESQPADKVIRLYEQTPFLFRSISYYQGETYLANEIPNGRFPIRMETTTSVQSNSIREFIDRLTQMHVNLDLPALLKPLMIDYITQQGDQLFLTAKGEKVVEIAQKSGINAQGLYLISKQLENIQTDESNYTQIMRTIAEALQVEV